MHCYDTIKMHSVYGAWLAWLLASSSLHQLASATDSPAMALEKIDAPARSLLVETMLHCNITSKLYAISRAKKLQEHHAPSMVNHGPTQLLELLVPAFCSAW